VARPLQETGDLEGKVAGLTRLLAESNARLAATSEVLRIISDRPGDRQSAVEAIAERALALCDAANVSIWLVDGPVLRIVIRRGAGIAGLQGLQTQPIDRGSATGRAVVDRTTVHIHDMEAEPEAEYPLHRDRRIFFPVFSLRRTILSTPLLREGTAIGGITILRDEVRPFSESQISLFETFASQAVIAIENARLIDELKQRLEEQTATAEVLRIIARSPYDLTAVFRTIAENVMRLCRYTGASVWRAHESELLRIEFVGVGSGRRTRESLIGDREPIDATTLQGRAIVERRVIYNEDLSQAPADDVAAAKSRQGGAGSMLSVPLLRGDQVFGAINTAALTVTRLSDRQIALVQSFADQAVIAISNAELFQELQDRNRELKAALDQQTVTSEVLRVIASSPTDLGRVLDTIAESAARLTNAETARIVRLDGDVFRLAGKYGTRDVGIDEVSQNFYQRGTAITRGTANGRAIVDQRTVRVHDMAAAVESDFPEARQVQAAGGYRSIVATPLLREGKPIGVLAVHRYEVRPFTDEQVRLLESFADQAVIAIENSRLFTELQQRLEEQTATAEVLRVISESPTDVQRVLDTIATAAGRLCQAGLTEVFQVQADRARMMARSGPRLGIPIGLSGPVDRGSLTGRAIVDRQTIHVPDILALPEEEYPSSRQGFLEHGNRSGLSVPLLRGGVAIGVINVHRAEAGPFSDRQIKLLETFADQAVIAISNAELFQQLQDRNRELSEALEQQTATSAVLQTISRSAFDLQLVLDTLAENIATLTGADVGAIFRLEGDRLPLWATHGASAEWISVVEAEPVRLDRASVTGRAALERRSVRIVDALMDPEYQRHDAQRVQGFRSVLAAPLLHQDDLLGAIAVWKNRVEPFSDRHLDLIHTFADQAVIAIENTRLFTELEQRLEEQTAMAEVLQIISQSPTDLQRVLDTVAERARSLCQGSECGIYRLAGDSFRAVALSGPLFGTLFAPNRGAVMPVPLEGSITGRAWRERRAIHVHDLAAALENDYAGVQEHQKIIGHRTTLAVPLLRGDEAIGVVVLARLEVRPFSDREIALLETFADQAVIAISNAELFQQLQDRNRDLKAALDQQTVTSEVLRVIASSPTDLSRVLATIVESAARLTIAETASIFRLDADVLRLAAKYGTRDADIDEVRQSFYHRGTAISRGTAIGRAIVDRRTIHIHDMAAAVESDFPESRQVRAAGGYRTIVTTPLLREGKPIGVLIVHRYEVSPFTDEQVRLLESFADQAVIAIENSRLFTELQQRLEEQTATAEVLRVISESPTDLQRVLDTIAAAAERLCQAALTEVFQVETDGIRIMARSGSRPGVPIGLTGPPGRGSLTGRAIVDRQTIHVPDILALPEEEYPISRPFFLQYGNRSGLSVPLLRGGVAIGVINVRRAEAGPYSDRQIKLLETFADQAVIAISNAELFQQLQERNRELSEALEQQMATSAVLQTISRSAFDLQSVLETLLESAARLCAAESGVILRFDGAQFVPQTTFGMSPDRSARLIEALNRNPLGPGPDSFLGRMALERRTIRAADLLQDPTYARTDILEVLEVHGPRSLIDVPLLRGGDLIGAFSLSRRRVDPFTDKQVALVETFADQAVIAMENSRLISELQQRLEEQTATAEVLRVISESPTELQKVLDTIAAAAARLCPAALTEIIQVQPGGVGRAVARYGSDLGAAVGPVNRDTVTGRAIVDLRTIHVPDILATPPDEYPRSRETFQRFGNRGGLSVPLLRGGKAIGAISVRRAEPGPFADRQIKLLETFADQAVIAISNAELFQQLQDRNQELSEALEQQTATAEVLRVIASAPTDLNRVLTAIVDSAARLCGASEAFMRLIEGDRLMMVAAYGAAMTTIMREHPEAAPMPIDYPNQTGLAVARRTTVRFDDVNTSSDLSEAHRQTFHRFGLSSMIAVPLLRGGEPLGAILLARTELAPFTEAEVALVESFADQAVIAIENSRLFTELQQRLEEQTAMAEALRVMSESPTELSRVLDTIVGSAARLCESNDAVVARAVGEVWRVVATYGAEFATELAESYPITRGWMIGRAILEQRTIHVEDLAALVDTEYPDAKEGQRELGHRTAVTVPLLRGGTALGAIQLRRREVRPFAEKHVRLLETFADQVAIAISNAELFQQLQDRNHELTRALEQQTATSAVLQTISRSAFDLQTVLDTLSENAVRLCHAEYGGIYRFDGEVFRWDSHYPDTPEQAAFAAYLQVNPRRPGDSSMVGRVGAQHRVVHVEDVLALPEYALTEARGLVGYRTSLCVPLLRDGVLLGAFALARNEVHAFSEREVDLVSTFADQAVIAMENTRLIDELQQRLEEQTATAEVLRVISESPTELQRVLDTIAVAAARLCNAGLSEIFRMEGEDVKLAARHGPLAGIPIGAGLRPTRRQVTGRAILDRRTVHVPDILAEAANEFSGSRNAFQAFGNRSGLSLPLMRGETAIGAISIRRAEPGPFSERQIKQVETFADQAAIAISNAELFQQLQDRNRELTAALDQQTATADVLRLISTAPTDLSSTLHAVAERAARLCGANDALIQRVESDTVVTAAHFGSMPGVTIGMSAPLNRGSTSGRAIIEKRAILVEDLATEPDEEFPVAKQYVRSTGTRTILAVPLLRNELAIGTIAVRRTEVRPFTEAQIEVLKTFADQAVIAIENTRLFTELQQRLEEQTATAEVLRVISESPTELQKVLNTIASAAARLCGTIHADIFRMAANGLQLELVAHYGDLEGLPFGWLLPLSRDSVSGRSILDCQTIHVPDILALPENEYPVSRRLTEEYGARSHLAVPLLRRDKAIGNIAVRRPQAGSFTSNQIKLLETFADQAVIAISNAELFQQLQDRNRELSEALEHQTATSDVLKIIGRSAFDLQPILDTLVENARRLCAAEWGLLYQFDGEVFRPTASSTLAPDQTAETARQNPPRPGDRSVVGQMATLGETLQVADVAEMADYRYAELRRAAGYRTVLAVPLQRDAVIIGAFSLTRNVVSPFTDKQVELVETFADQAVIAIENARLIGELQQRLEEQTAMAEVLELISRSAFDLQRVFDTLVVNAAKLSGADVALLTRKDGDRLLYAAHYGAGQEFREAVLRNPATQGRDSAAGRVLLERRPVLVEDALTDPDYAHPSRAAASTRSVLGVPLLRDGEPVGVFSVARREVRPFTSREVALLQTFANQAVIAIENVRLLNELQERTRELAASVDQLKAVFEVGQAVSSSLDLETVLRTIGTHAIALSGADGGGIFELDERTQSLRLRTSHQQDPELVAVLRRTTLKVGEGAAGRAVATREPIQIPDATVEGAYQGSLRDILIRSGFRAVLAVPLLHENRVLGALVVNRNTPGEFAPEVVELVKTFASQSAIALQNARLFQELEEKNRALELAGRHKSQFLANMSHELRTPLNAILGYTELIQDGIYGDTPARISEVLERVEQSGRHLLGLINAVLDLSKIEAGQLILALADYSIADVVQLAVGSVESLAAEKSLALRVDVAPDLPIVYGDERRISQVLLNLVGNAIKFTETGEIRVSASAANGSVVVSVSDTGPGIAAPDQDRIFEEFQQVDASSTRAKGGTGLGLAIAKRIVELHGGRIWVESTPGEGSTFTFSLPIRVGG
jgi:GAF domain-containing protein